MPQLSKTTRLKLFIPFIYFGCSLLFFLFTWPPRAETHHLIGVLVAVVGFLLWLIARIQLGNAFTIAPEAHFIVSGGLYSKFRHPVYYFSTLAVIGLGIYIWLWPMLVVLAVMINLEAFRLQKEDEQLTKKFGQQYLEYKKSTWL